jgi:hypothetical protein
MSEAKDRPFTRFAATMVGGLDALERGDCPTCKGPVGLFRDELSRKEFGISGMCQECQDKVFGDPEDDQ